MLAKLTAKNQLTLPKRALQALGSGTAPTYFDVAVQGGRIILTPAPYLPFTEVALLPSPRPRSDGAGHQGDRT